LAAAEEGVGVKEGAEGFGTNAEEVDVEEEGMEEAARETDEGLGGWGKREALATDAEESVMVGWSAARRLGGVEPRNVIVASWVDGRRCRSYVQILWDRSLGGGVAGTPRSMYASIDADRG
jgi:hypothetical protein